MLDFGWSEFFLIIVLAIVLLGPKEIPDLLYGFGRLVRRVQYLKFALSKQFDSFMEQADLQDIRKGGLGELDPRTIMRPLPPAPPSDASTSNHSAEPDPSAPDDTMEDDNEFYGEKPNMELFADTEILPPTKKQKTRSGRS